MEDRSVIDLTFDLKNNIAPEAAAKIWKPIVDLVLSLCDQLDDAFSRSRISNEAMKKSVPRFVGVVESLKSIHGQTFGEFAKQAEVVARQN